jgi:D-alanine--poly(phosphoribitol) ligase subunit 1
MATIQQSTVKSKSRNSATISLRGKNDVPVVLKRPEPFPDRASLSVGVSDLAAGPEPRPKARARFKFLHEALGTLTEADRRLFGLFGSGEQIAPDFPLVHAGIEYWASVQPDAPAAEHLGDIITYRDLDRQAARLASILLESNIRPGDNVALFLRRSIPMLVGILACLKIGAAYVPADVKVVPGRQLRQMVRCAKARIILTASCYASLIPDCGQDAALCVDEIMAAPISGTFDLRLPRPVNPKDNCFVLFTSGTTGTPNGVQVTHANVCNILLTAPGNLGMRPGRKVSQLLSIGFDMAAWETLGALANGATLVIRGRDFTAPSTASSIMSSG